MQRNAQKLWTRDLVLASLANFFLSFVFYLLMTTMALYAISRFAASDPASGLASSMFVIGATIARLFAGWLTDQIGRRRILIISLVVFIAASLGYLAAGSLGMLLAVRAVHGAAFAVASTAAMAIAQAIIPVSRRAEGTGYFTLSMTLATAIGPFLALTLVDGPGYTALFWAATIASVLAMVTALALRISDRPAESKANTRSRRFRLTDMLHPRVVPVATFMFIMAIAYSGVLTFLNSFATERGLQSVAGTFFLVYAVVLFLARLVAGRLQDSRGDNVIVYPATLAFACGLVVLAFASSGWMVLVAGGLMGLGYGTLMSAVQSIAVSLAPREQVGVAISTHFFMVDLGVGVGPVLLGFLLGYLGFSTMYLVLGGVVFASTLLYLLVHGRASRIERATGRVEATDRVRQAV